MEMLRFESAYHEWLDEVYEANIPRYPVVNRLVRVLDTLTPCGCCDDHCDNDEEYEIPRKEKWL